MPLGDILVIKDGHKTAAAGVAEMVAENWTGEKMSLAIGAESGAGKSEIAHQVASNLFKSDLALNPHFPDELVNRCPEMEIML